MIEQLSEPILGFRSWTVQPKPRRMRAMPQRPSGADFIVGDLMSGGTLRVDEMAAAFAEQQYQADLSAWEDERRRRDAEPPPYSLLSLNGGGVTEAIAAENGGTVWHGPVANFACPYGHKKPDRRCGCGLYAVFSLNRATWGGRGGYQVTGAVIAWGRVIFHEMEGFRAEHLRIVALAESPDNQPVETYGSLGLELETESLAEKAAAKIGVPCVDYKHLTAHAREHGRLVTASWEYHYE